MTISRLLILQALLACGLGTIFFIPHDATTQPCRVRMELPETLGGWQGKTAPISDKEHEILAGDTQFCRKVYNDGFGDEVLVSIVLSGNELDQSIHRPERCLPAQGWSVEDSGRLALPVAAAPGGTLPVTRLHCLRQLTHNGQVVNLYNLNYYWFIGYSDITASHFEREYIDMRDRLLHGYNQRWAYVTVAATVTRGLPGYGGSGMDEAQTDATLKKMITQVFPLIVTDPGGAKPAL